MYKAFLSMDECTHMYLCRTTMRVSCKCTITSAQCLPAWDAPQYFRKSFKPVGTSGAWSCNSRQCSLQKAFPCSGEEVHTLGRLKFGIWATQFWMKIVIICHYNCCHIYLWWLLVVSLISSFLYSSETPLPFEFCTTLQFSLLFVQELKQLSTS